MEKDSLQKSLIIGIDSPGYPEGILEEVFDKNKCNSVLAEIEKQRERRKLAAVEEEKAGLVIFNISDDIYAFYDTDVKEILSYQEIALVPGCPDSFLGIINVRGDIESVINIHKLIGVSGKKPDKDTRIIIAERGDIRSGILVDCVRDVINVPLNALKQPLSTIDPAVKEFAVAGETIYADQYVTILDIEKIFKKLQAGI